MTKNKNMILELPREKESLARVMSDTNHDIKHIAFSSVVVKDEVKHYVLIVWNDTEYGDHQF
ncbi:MAG TPA: hypothetical protein PL033_20415 [Candidatus Brocadiia bacterium]|nr:hypothetical protein [Candidatus Brocadiia bacterium]